MQYITGKIGKTAFDSELFLVDSKTGKKTPLDGVTEVEINLVAGEITKGKLTFSFMDVEVEQAEVIGDPIPMDINGKTLPNIRKPKKK